MSTENTVDRGDELISPLANAGKDAAAATAGDDKAGTKDTTAPNAEKEPAKDSLDTGEETPEEKAEREKAEEEARKKANIRIPKFRFDQAQAKAREREAVLLEEIAKLKGGQHATEQQKAVDTRKGDIEKLQDKYEDLILDGKKDEARKVRRQLETMREELVDYQTSIKSDAARRAAVEELTYNAKLASLESNYPVINPDNEAFDEDVANEVGDLLDAFIKKGMKRADALAKAAKYVLGPVKTPEKETKTDAEKVADAAKTLAEARAKAAREKNAEAAGRQPASTAKIGADTDKAGKGGEGGIDIMRLSQDKFAALDAETLSKLRGDLV